MHPVTRLVLVGLSGSGKSTVAGLAAELLGWSTADMDSALEEETGITVPEFFRQKGESAFRVIERRMLQTQLARHDIVIATGGGAPVDIAAWEESLLGDARTLVVWLDAAPEVLVARLARQAAAFGDVATRPLLEGDALGRLTAMRDDRVVAYRRAAVAVGVDDKTPDVVAQTCADLVRLMNGEALTIDLASTQRPSAIQVGRGSVDRLGEVIRSRWSRAQQAFIAVDEGVRPYVDHVIDSISGVMPRGARVLEIPSGEQSKSFSGLERVHDWMLDGVIERTDVAVAVGGGVVGDLVGFAASTILRGVGLVQVPTTLLAMVDSSVGGKTGINHAAGKNLIGTFYQPDMVLIDPDVLGSLPDREYVSGWAEIIKHAVVEASVPGRRVGLYDMLHRNSDLLRRRQGPLLDWTISHNVSLKAAVVEHDEREMDLRAILNFGHTLGHAVEASGYQLLHGEAIAVGMCGAMHIAREMNRFSPAGEEEIRVLIQRFGLPTVADVEASAVLQHLQHDKKRLSDVQRWVLPKSGGGVELVTGVPDHIVRSALAAITGPT